VLKAKQKLGKYRIEGKLSEGNLTTVYRAADTIEGLRVALKLPRPELVDETLIESFRQEARIAARLDHPSILPLKNADVIDGQFVIASLLGEQTLADRLLSRLATSTCISYAKQTLAGLAYAHTQNVIHCDVKPENFILFAGNRIRLADFGISKVAASTIRASGSGTVGYMAPEQAMGRPSFRSDVFALGLVLYRMFSGHLPEWPFEWPCEGYTRLTKRISPAAIEVLRRSIEVDQRKRYANASEMEAAFLPACEEPCQNAKQTGTRTKPRLQTELHKRFSKQYGQLLQARYKCNKCSGPVSEAMRVCPWCGTQRNRHKHTTRFPAHCTRCHRGMKLDWQYCPWCYGPGYEPHSARKYTDTHYQGRCPNTSCERKQLMPFMRYCPWCHKKVQRKWKIPGSNSTCKSCNWGTLPEFWSFCAWCGKMETRHMKLRLVS
jgi:serine/threonine-protein kinase